MKRIKPLHIAVLYSIIVTALLLMRPANADKSDSVVSPACGTKHDIIHIITNTYQEKLTAIGISNFGNGAALYTSPDGSFSVVEHEPNRGTCIVLAGTNWQDKLTH